MPGPRLPRRGRPGRRAAALIITCAVMAGGAFAVIEAVSGPGGSALTADSAAAPTPAPTPASGPGGQAAVLNGVLADVSSGSPAASGAATQPAASGAAARRVALRRLRRALIRLRRLGGMYGQYTFEAKKGPRTLAFERGTVTSVTGANVVVRAEDGTTWTWVLTGTSVVREDGTRAKASAIADGQTVFAAGPVSGTTRDARLIVIRQAAKNLG